MGLLTVSFTDLPLFTVEDIQRSIVRIRFSKEFPIEPSVVELREGDGFHISNFSFSSQTENTLTRFHTDDLLRELARRSKA